MIQLSKEQLEAVTDENIAELQDLVKPVLEHRKKLYKRFKRKDQPYSIMNESNGRIMPFENYSVNIAKGYIGGVAPDYDVVTQDKSKPDDYAVKYEKNISEIQSFNDDGTVFMDVVTDYLITGASYILAYQIDGQIKYAQLSSEQTVGIYDYSIGKNLIGLYRQWTEKDLYGNEKTVVEIYTGKYRRKFEQTTDNSYKCNEKEELVWNGEVPAVGFESKDGLSFLEPSLDIINLYEQIMKNIGSMTEYNDNAKLLLVNYKSEFEGDEEGRKKEDKELYEAPTIYVSDDGDVRWLLKDINYQGLIDVLKVLHDQITMFTGTPNMTDEAFSSADNASALGYKLYALEQFSESASKILRKGLARLWQLITIRLNQHGENFDAHDINIKMRKNLPNDKDKAIDRALKMKTSGMWSDSTCRSESGVDVDDTEEEERLLKQEADEFTKMQTQISKTFSDDKEEDSPEDIENEAI